MQSILLRRIGVWALGIAAFLAISAPYLMPEAEVPTRVSLAKNAAAIGALILAVGYLLELGASSRKPCSSCGGKAARGSVFCVRHREDLRVATRQVMAQRRH